MTINVNPNLVQSLNVPSQPALTPPAENPFKLFENPEFGKLHITDREGNPWFVARDVATALGYTNPRDAVLTHCKYAKLLKGRDSLLFTTSPRGITIIPESDVYALIFRSNLPKAESFRRWLCEEVLPSIRKTGSYSVQPALPDFTNPVVAARAWADQYEARLATEQKLEQTEQTLQQYSTALGKLVDFAKEQKATIEAQANELGIGNTYKTVTGIPWLSEYFDLTIESAYSQIGRALSEWCRILGYEKLMVKHPKYPQGVGNYHIDVIAAFRNKLDSDPLYMAKYRLAK